jgi:hypothetical protein
MLALLGSDDREEILVYYMNWLDPRFAQNEALSPKTDSSHDGNGYIPDG